MSRTIHFRVAVTVPNDFGPVTEDLLLALCGMKCKGENLGPAISLLIRGGDFGVVGRPIVPQREKWKEKIFGRLSATAGRRYTTAMVADFLELKGNELEERKALGETLERMATRGLICRERQAGYREWSYYR